MRDYWMTQYLLAAVGWGYLIVCLIAIGLALWLPKSRQGKAIAAAIVLGLASIMPIQGYQGYQKDKQATDEYQARYAKAKALFDERCKTAGEKIYQTVEGVEGVLLMKVRPKTVNFADQYAMDDPYGRDVGGDGYIASFVRATAGLNLDPIVTASYRSGYRWVEVADTDTGTFNHYTGAIKVITPYNTNFQLDATRVLKSNARFGVTYDDISTREDRDNWIAGGVIKVVDTKTNEVIAQRIGYIFDAALGNTSGFRGPWEAASPCQGADRKYGHNAEFIFKALKPT
jgi:hypothetical protein